MIMYLLYFLSIYCQFTFPTPIKLQNHYGKIEITYKFEISGPKGNFSFSDSPTLFIKNNQVIEFLVKRKNISSKTIHPKIKKTTIDTAYSINVDTTYNFVDLQHKTYVEYAELSTQSSIIGSGALSNKKFGAKFLQADFDAIIQKKTILKNIEDTLINGKLYKLLKGATAMSRPENIGSFTAIIDTTIIGFPIKLSPTLNKKVSGFIKNLTITGKNKPFKVTFKQKFFPQKMPSKVEEMFLAWGVKQN